MSRMSDIVIYMMLEKEMKEEEISMIKIECFVYATNSIMMTWKRIKWWLIHSILMYCWCE